MKNFLKINRALVAKKKLSLLFALLCASVMGWATEKFVPADASQNSTFFAKTDSWDVDNTSSGAYNSSTGVITIHIGEVKNAQWKAQYKLNEGCSYAAGKYYDFSIKFHASNGIGGVTIKADDNTGMLLENATIVLPADEDYVYTKTNVAGVDGGNGIMVFDFGSSPANTDIVISEISIVEKEPDPSAHWWDNVAYIGSSFGDSYANQYKMIAESGVSIVNIQGDPASIYVTASTDVGLTCSLGSTNYHTQGAGMYLHLSAFTTQETIFTITDNSGTYTCKVYNKEGTTGGAANPQLTLTNPTKSSVLLPKGEKITVTYTSDNDAAASIASEQAYVSISGNEVTAASTGTATVTVSQAEVEGTWQAASVSFEVNAFDWSDISFIPGSDYKMKASSSSVNIVNVQLHSGHNCIYINVPDAVDVDCSLTGNFEVEGAGIFLYTDAFTVRQTPFTVTCHGNTYDCYVLYNLDETAPVISNVAVTSHTHERALLTITADEAFVSAEVFNNGVSMGTFTPATGAITVTGLTAATKYDKLTVKVKDAANNWSDAVAVPEFTTSAAPSITPKTYNGYGTQKGVYALYSITRDYDQSLVFSVKVDAAFGFNKRVHYYKGGVADVWEDLTYNSSTDTYDYTAAAGSFVDGEEWVVEFYFPFTGDAASIVCNYTVGSEQAVPASIPVGAVVLNKASNTLSVGETDNLTATVYPSFATSAGSITWASDAPAYASVDAGTVTAVAAGTANITATCGGVTSVPCEITVAASLAEAKYYGIGTFTDFSDEKNAFAYEFCFTRASDHNVTLDVVFSQDMTGIIGNDNFRIYVNGDNKGMTYNASTKTASYDFGKQSDGTGISYYFYFIMAGGVHQTPNATYTVGSSHDKVYACVVDEDIDNAAVLAAYDGRTAQVIVDRSFAADNLYTLVMPFSADAEQTAAKLPGSLTKLNNTIIKDNEDLRVNFVNADAIEAGVPYLYTPSADVVNPVFADVTIDKDLNPSVPADGYASYHGIYAPLDGDGIHALSDAYVLGSDQYLYSVANLPAEQTMKALRGYFVLNFPVGSSQASARVVFNTNEVETATGMESIQSSAISVQKVLENGQVLIIRDGRTYNAQGQMIK